MSLPERVAGGIATHSRLVLVAMVIATALVGAGVPALEGDTSLEQYETESPEAAALEYVQSNFTADENTTSVQVIVRGDDVLGKESLVASLKFQRAIRADESIEATLVDDEPTVGVANVVATTAIRERRAAALEARATDLERRGEALNATAASLEASLNETRDLQREYERLNASHRRGNLSDEAYRAESAAVETEFDRVLEEATADLDATQAARFERAVSSARTVETELATLDRAYERGAISDDEYEGRTAVLESELDEVYADGTVGVLTDEYDRLRTESEHLADERAALESTDLPPLDDQLEALESLNESESEAAVASALSGEGPGGDRALELMPSTYEPGTADADARMLLVGQSTGGDGTDDDVVDSQLEVRDLAAEHGQGDETYVVFGPGIVFDEIDRSMADSLAIVGPLALCFVVTALLVAYRDPLDVALGVVGVGVVLVWTFGFMGWAGIAFNQLFVAVPALLIGLSIDYAIHVFMRHREHRGAPRTPAGRARTEATRETPRASMAVALAGVGAALVWVTATTAIGFLSNVVSPIAPVREFGAVSAAGIVAALLVFGAMVPAAKVELDARLEARGWDRRRRAVGTGGGRLADSLSVGAIAARRAPLAVLLVAALVTAGGIYGAAQVDTSFDRTDFLADDPPAWTDRLPAVVRPGDYRAKDDLEYLEDRFRREGAQVHLLVRGDVTAGETLERVAAAERAAADGDVTYELPTGEADVQSPLAPMEAAAAENDSFNATYQLADTDDNGVPDQNLVELYDELYEIDPEGAREVLHRTGAGEYEAVRLAVAVRGDAGSDETTDEMRAIAAGIDDGADDRREAIATGDPIAGNVVEREQLETVLESLLITLVASLAFLTVGYRLTGAGATLGAVTLAPVALAVSWILGSMYLVGMAFNVLTGMITSLAIGLGVDYSIHVSTRYTHELERRRTAGAALRATVTGTGGALLGSAATTAGGFVVLSFAILPVLRQFGIIAALTIVYAFVASVVVLPTLLVLWTKYARPDVPLEHEPAAAPPSSAGEDEAAGDSIGLAGGSGDGDGARGTGGGDE